MTANRICQLRVRSTALALSVLSCIFFASCLFIPVRTPKTTAGAAGPAERGVDLTFLERGKTTRDEVLSKLAFMNTGCDSRTLFWGRWSESQWSYLWFAAAGYQGTGGGGDVWKRSNLILEFVFFRARTSYPTSRPGSWWLHRSLDRHRSTY